MGKIKNFVTGLFSKKDDKNDEILQLQPASDPDRDLAEYENRYETPDYQAFLSDMGYIEKNETRNADVKEQDIDPDAVLEAGSFVEDAGGEPADSQLPCEVDQDFIDEGVAELGVNDVWPEEED